MKFNIPDYLPLNNVYYIYVGLWPNGDRYQTDIGIWPVAVKFWYRIKVTPK